MNRSDGSTADYYVLPEGATQIQDLISHRNMNAQIGEIIRACYRYGMASHSDMMRDAKKIRFYAQAEVERLEKLEAASEQCGQEVDKDGWIQTSGYECPVSKGVLVDVKYKDGDEAYLIPALIEGHFFSRNGEECGASFWGDIVAYRLAGPNERA